MPLLLGQTVNNRYQIQSVLGQGGMGVVYRAYDQRLHRVVAIKEAIPDPTASPQALAQARQQFLREAQVLAGLTHPNLPRVFDSFSLAGSEFVVMELIEGQSLDAVVQQIGPIHESTVLAWADQILDALEYIHGRSIIHRDIKPANIVLKPDRQVVLVDFGLVKLLDPNSSSSLSALRGMGTPEYSPLEQYSKGMRTDARSDIYSLGATLYHLLSGRAPAEAPTRLVNPAEQPQLRAIIPTITAQTQAVVDKASALQPQNRYQTAVAMRQAFRAHSTAPIFRNRKWVPIAIAALLLLLGMGLGGFILRDMFFPVTPTKDALALAPNGIGPDNGAPAPNSANTTMSPNFDAMTLGQATSTPLPSPTRTETVAPSLTATAVPPTPTPAPPTATSIPPTVTRRPATVAPSSTRQLATRTAAAAAKMAYPAPQLSGTCGSTLAPGDFILDISFPQGLKEDEAFDIRARPVWELNRPSWRGVAVIRENQLIIRGKGQRLEYAFINNPWERGNFHMTVAVIRVKDGNKMMAQLSPESNVCILAW